MLPRPLPGLGETQDSEGQDTHAPVYVCACTHTHTHTHTLTPILPAPTRRPELPTSIANEHTCRSVCVRAEKPTWLGVSREVICRLPEVLKSKKL